MGDLESSARARAWRRERTIEAAAAYVSVRLRRGPAGDGERAAWREATSRVETDAAEELFVDALLRDDPADARRALATLDGTPGDDRSGPTIDELGVVWAPVGQRWSAPTGAGTPGERFVAGWLATLPHAERVLVWWRALLSEPLVTDLVRRGVLTAALASTGEDVDALARRHVALVETVTRPVVYITVGADEGFPPAIECTYPELVHGLLRRALLHDARSTAGLACAVAVARAILERPEALLPSRCDLRLSAAQRLPPWRRAQEVGGRSLESALLVVERQLVDSYPLREALNVIAALPSLLDDERIRAAVDWLVAEGGERPVVARALVADLLPAILTLPSPVACALVERAGTWTHAPPSLVERLLRHGEEQPPALRLVADRTLLQIAARGGNGSCAFDELLHAALTPGSVWPWNPLDEPRPTDGPGPWLRALAPRLVRALATSPDTLARVNAAVLWRGGPADRYPGLDDVWERLAADEAAPVREALRAGRRDD